MQIARFLNLIFFAVLFSAPSIEAGIYSYTKENTVIGDIKSYTVKENDSLIEIARRFGLGYNEIADANPGVDSFTPPADTEIRIPVSWALPDVPLYSGPAYNGIVINLSEMRLYYFFREQGSSLVITFPIGIGSEGTDTPLGKFRVIEKIERPDWHVPESIRKERPELPEVVPPGPDNPLGSHALRLSKGDILIHGTNRPWGVGRKTSHGCIRLYPEDIPKLFKNVQSGAPVAIVRQPVKAGVVNHRVFVEVHGDDEVRDYDYFNEAVLLLKKKNLLKSISTEKLHKAVTEKSGMPVEISD